MFLFQGVFGQTARLFHPTHFDELRDALSPAGQPAAANEAETVTPAAPSAPTHGRPHHAPEARREAA